MTKQRALLLGGTGAMGVYLAPLLVERGFSVDVTSRSPRVSGNKVTYIQGDAHDSSFLESLVLKNKYDVIVDFMVYATDEFEAKLDTLLSKTTQYVYLSSYRVFADSPVITEDSPRLLDVSKDEAYLATDEYALSKARQENILRKSHYKNWTIVRPAITYSKERFQLGTLEMDAVVWRSLHNKRVILPDEILERTTVMTWAGDVAKMIAGLVLNKKAFGEDFNVATSQNQTWREVAGIYEEAIGLRLKAVGLEEYIAATSTEYQTKYDRMYDRKIDNSKVIGVVGPIEFMDLKKGLHKELKQFLKNPSFTAIDYALQARIDRLTYEIIDWKLMNKQNVKTYIKNRFPWTGDAVRLSKKSMSKTRSTLRIGTRVRQVGVAAASYQYKLMVLGDASRVRKINENTQGATITLIDYSNYGNVLQRFALQEFLFKKKYRFTSYEHELPIASSLSDKKHEKIVEFVDRYIARQPFDKSEELSAYVVGSDQVWRNWHYTDEGRDLGFFFLDFLKSTTAKRIAYAASFGKSTLKDASVSDVFSKKAKAYVAKFSAVSMREKSGIQIVEEAWGRKADEVIDPTFLLKARDYDRIIRRSSDRDTATSPVFVYILGPTDENKTLTATIADSMNVTAEVINPYHLEQLPSVAVWLKGIRDANLVITDSFHSTVFSIINNTPFIVIENEVGGIGRVEDLLSLLGISHDRIVRRHHELEYELAKADPIDWKSVNSKLDTLRGESASWLLEALSK